MQQTAQSYLVICIFKNFFKLFEDFVDTLYKLQEHYMIKI
jgi:hypothetical protein